jgi:2-dehydro-3-deoxyphosphogluconate aldolase/(4S)-4-hydroxy-2-oxoglutarate aldolase
MSDARTDPAPTPATSADGRPRLPPAVTEGRLVAIARRRDPAVMPALAAALVAGGVHVLEVTVDGDGALETIADLAGRHGPDELLLGAGTVLDASMAARAAEAGARFIVSPTLELDVLAWCVGHGVPCLPGAFTPTEVLAAWRAGAAAVKLFPASALGPSFLRELRGPLPGIPIVPTGGIDAATAGAFLAAGAAAVGVGGWLTGSGEPDAICERAAELVRVVAAAPPPGGPGGLASGR